CLKCSSPIHWLISFCLAPLTSPRSTLFPYTTLFRSHFQDRLARGAAGLAVVAEAHRFRAQPDLVRIAVVRGLGVLRPNALQQRLGFFLRGCGGAPADEA